MYPPKKTILNVDFALKLSLYIVELFYMSQMNPKEFFHNTTYSAELPYIHTYNFHLKMMPSKKFNYQIFF